MKGKALWITTPQPPRCSRTSIGRSGPRLCTGEKDGQSGGQGGVGGGGEDEKSPPEGSGNIIISELFFSLLFFFGVLPEPELLAVGVCGRLGEIKGWAGMEGELWKAMREPHYNNGLSSSPAPQTRPK